MSRPLAWLLQDVPLERAPPGSKLDAALRAAGAQYAVASYKPGHGLQAVARDYPRPQDNLTGPLLQHWRTTRTLVLPWGGIQFCRAVAQQLGAENTLQLGSSPRNHYMTYTAELADQPWLNHDALALPWAALRRSLPLLQRVHPGAGVFVRPNTGFKTFAGQLLPYKDWELECHKLDATSSLMPDTLVVTASTKHILGEFRFVVADGRVVAGSEYRWDGKTDLRRDWPPECEQVAAGVAAAPWQLDRAYVVDVGLTPQGPRLVELNSFCHAGLYACDLAPIVAAVTAIAETEL